MLGNGHDVIQNSRLEEKGPIPLWYVLWRVFEFQREYQKSVGKQLLELRFGTARRGAYAIMTSQCTLRLVRFLDEKFLVTLERISQHVVNLTDDIFNSLYRH